MKHLQNILFFTLAFTIIRPSLLMSQTRPRSEVPQEDTWNLADLFPSDQLWQQAKDRLAASSEEILQYKGKLAESPSELLKCLQFNSDFMRKFSRLYCYAQMKSDQDTRIAKYQAMRQELEHLLSDYRAKASFIDPELLQMNKKQIEEFIRKESGLKVFRFYLHDLQRTRKHTLSTKEEKIIAQAGLLTQDAYNIFSILSNAELPYPKITLANGKQALINKAGYSRYRALPGRSDREAVFKAFWQVFKEYHGTLGALLYAEVKKDMFYARARGYESSLVAALDKNNIPTEVYTTLIRNIHNNLATLHRYLKLKKRMLGVKTLKYSDLYAPTVQNIDMKFTFQQAKQLVLAALEPLGMEYIRYAKQALNNRWIDVYPTPGKRAGAYSEGGAYDVHPYILLNYNGSYDDVSTLAHELGHTMHSFYANKFQPYPTADYATFVAEVASTFNEALLINKMLHDIKDPDTRLSLLMDYLENIRLTVFRQGQFAEFEWRIHQKAERGEPLTGENLDRLYGDILKKYYGNDKGICHIDDLYDVEWAYIPHFYYNFYVYQYATSFTASTYLAGKVLSREKDAAKNYIRFLSSGGSDYPIAILKRAGVDMTSPEPFDKTMAAMNHVMDEIESILDKRPPAK